MPQHVRMNSIVESRLDAGARNQLGNSVPRKGTAAFVRRALT
jgi:hypothetical protein